jgi:leader peptidase (prepilin peptidase)/N-methyltransferase
VNVPAIDYLVVLAGLFILGSVFGSLLNVAIYRIPREERFWKAMRYMVYPPSHCPRCQAPIAPRDNIPIIAWLSLRGRCRSCRGAISIRYPLVELLSGTLFALVYWFEVPHWFPTALAESSVCHPLGPTGIVGSSWMSPLMVLHWRYAVHMVLVIALVVATFIDIDLRIIPDGATLPAMAIAVAAHTILGQIYIVPLGYKTSAMSGAAILHDGVFREIGLSNWCPGWSDYLASAAGVPAWITAHPHLHGLAVSLAGMIVGGGSIWAVRIVGTWALRREAMGFGDVVLMAMIGSFIGWQGTLIIFALSLVWAIVVALPLWIIWRDHELPFGPYLALGTLVLLLAARAVWPWFDTRIFALGPMLVPMALFMVASLAGLLAVWRVARRGLGFAPLEPEFEEAWGAGDQLAYLAGECTDDRQGQWPRDDWPGRLSARGQSQHHLWRHGPR